jgi:osmotically inducible protein OsmC
MTTSTATAVWNGTLKEGKGEMNVAQQSFPFSFSTRMEAGEGNTPETMLASALAGCFSMALSADLGKAGFEAQQVKSTAKANFGNASGKWTVETIDLDIQANVPGIDDSKFQEIANGTKSGCPVARALSAVQINLTAKLF